MELAEKLSMEPFSMEEELNQNLNVPQGCVDFGKLLMGVKTKNQSFGLFFFNNVNILLPLYHFNFNFDSIKMKH